MSLAPTKGAAANKTPSKSGWELLMDPHFVFTICSLVVSVTVFFFYLYKLLCDNDDLTQQFNEDLERRRQARAAALRLSRSGQSGSQSSQGAETPTTDRRTAAAQALKAELGTDEARALEKARAKVDPAKAKKDDDLVRRIAEAEAGKLKKEGGDAAAARKVARKAPVPDKDGGDEGMRKRK